MSKTMPAQRPGRSKQDVRTPQNFLSATKAMLGITEFVVDLAASDENTVEEWFYDQRANALEQPWVFNGWNWLNPPFADINPWARRAYQESLRGANTAMLVPAGVGANWWRDWVHSKARVLLLNGRLTFVGHTQPYPKDCALLLYSPTVIPAYEVWSWMQPQPAAQKPARLESVAYDASLHLPPGECAIQLMTDQAGAECLAAGVVPRYLKEQARNLLALADDCEQVPA